MARSPHGMLLQGGFTAALQRAPIASFRETFAHKAACSMDFDAVWDVEGTVWYLVQRRFRRPALQFPDEHLAECKAVAEAVRTHCDQAGHSVEVLKSCRFTSVCLRLLAGPASALHLVVDAAAACIPAGVCVGGHVI